MEPSPDRVSILSVINETSSRSVDLIELLSDKIDVLFADMQKLTDQHKENNDLILRLFHDMQAPPAVRAKRAPKAAPV